MQRRGCSPTRQGNRFRPGVEWLEDRLNPANFVVNTPDDIANPGPGVTSLRSAVELANANLAGGIDSITFAGNLFAAGSSVATVYLLKSLVVGQPGRLQTIRIVSPEVGKTVTVERDGLAIGGFSMVQISQATRVWMSGMTIKGGRAAGNAGAGVRVDGDLTLDSCVVTDNQTAAGGGGIYLSSLGTSLVLQDTDVTGNRAVNNGGGIYVAGGVLDTVNQERVLIQAQSQVWNNTSDIGSGGGIYVGPSVEGTRNRLKIDSSVINRNTSKLRGGGLCIDAGTAFEGIIKNSWVGYNQSLEGVGGALYTAGHVEATGTDFDYNKGGAADGYAVAVGAGGTGPLLELTSCSVVHSMFAPPAGSPPGLIGTAVAAGDRKIQFTTSRVLDNTGRGVSGTVISGGGNTVSMSRDWSTGWLPPPQDLVT